ncbi:MULTISPECIES: bifunctional riboflavin kinase/FAD synthetase [Vibrio]|jgi:riboflavin kinase/FMN adenylyltransferase|uniref:Riboflavin biosynthesis protein n=1 Tax=Vibrio mediterranei TaxID=689 RepID=A0A3G4VB11_9VIBR|nr:MULTISPECIES: bifunctional riboflavin kinase/FAD synthetase [Vibrio]AYV21946.1 bifunctional riboflavin kinase/FAD synthetase [Vibrio mediterranei]EDL51022.1 bifunctional riboflavin kinase/FMN adenylyltransferase [Vibrio mediterranei AK1]MCY9851579.1 bifunctional riboflavin kinase/FAD synthetase [Vibrio mediterranei]NOH27446.1 bifunctional riboflavin kinase/FAD synthetase [Vibrio mediterranei]NUW71335.1 bifunctional riboflavin kinase/FAD synthetase [Vibrio mediterranei]
MELIRGIHNLKNQHHGCVLTIGNFDGVHLGHQRVLEQVKKKALLLGLPAVVMTFEPQPMELFAKDKAPARLTRLRDKFELLEAMHLDRLLCVNFNRRFASMSPESFIKDLLVNKLGVKFLVIGDDFRFGKGREGNFDMLKKAGEEFGFEVVNTASFCVEDTRVSSTAIRQALASDHLDESAEMLGRHYTLSGRVAHGQKLARDFGFPTANISLKRYVSPVRGVYAVQVYGVDSQPLPGIANVGKKPTVAGTTPDLEVHIFDFEGNLYGKQIEVALLHKIRDEKKFESLELLKQQIELDADVARVWLRQFKG